MRALLKEVEIGPRSAEFVSMGQLKVFPEQAVVGLALKLGIITLTKQPQYVDMLSIRSNRHGNSLKSYLSR